MNRANKNRNDLFLVSLFFIVVLIVTFSYGYRFNITGMASGNAYVGINSTFNGTITAFSYFPRLNLTQSQNTTIEFTNTGNVLYNVTIRESIYIYENGLLNLTKTYTDNTVPLYPGMRKHLQTFFVPPRIGTYYIRAFVNYGPRNVETWRTFTVSLPYEEEEGPEGGETVSLGGSPPPTRTIFAGSDRIDLQVNYTNYFEMYPGQTLMTGISAGNKGNVTLDRIRLYISTPTIFDVSFNPKEIFDLDPNESSLFLMTIRVDEDSDLGVHLIAFDVITDEAKENGVIRINVTPYAISRRDEISNRIISNKYFIVELERQILQAFTKGINTTLVEELLDQAKLHLQTAEEYFEIGEYEKASEELDKKDDKLNEVVFNLANESFRVFEPPSFAPLWLLFFAILLAIIFLILEDKKRKRRKPRLLRGSEESEA